MATLLYRLGKAAYRRWPIALAVWLLALAGVGAIAATMSQPMSDQFSIPGIPSEKATDLQQELFPGSGNAIDEASVSIVVAAPEGATLAEEPYAGRVAALIEDGPPGLRAGRFSFLSLPFLGLGGEVLRQDAVDRVQDR